MHGQPDPLALEDLKTLIRRVDEFGENLKASWLTFSRKYTILPPRLAEYRAAFDLSTHSYYLERRRKGCFTPGSYSCRTAHVTNLAANFCAIHAKGVGIMMQDFQLMESLANIMASRTGTMRYISKSL